MGKTVYRVVTVRLTPEEYQALKGLARDSVRTVPGYICRVLRDYLAHPERNIK